jgi:hypothetical protein
MNRSLDHDPEGDRGDLLPALMRWYAAQCDGDWEHQRGVTIDTLDNPGWRLAVDLVETDVAGWAFDRVERHRSDSDWVVAWRDEEKFQGACGALNLTELLGLFLGWVGSPEPHVAPTPALTPDVVERATAIGLDLGLAARYGPDRVRWVLDALDAWRARNAVPQPAAWAARTLQEHWGLPPEAVQRALPFAEAAASAARPPDGTRWAREKATGALFTVTDVNDVRVQLAGGVAVPSHHWAGWEWLADSPEGFAAAPAPAGDPAEDARRAALARMAAWVAVRTRSDGEVAAKLAALGLSMEEWRAYREAT